MPKIDYCAGDIVVALDNSNGLCAGRKYLVMALEPPREYRGDRFASVQPHGWDGQGSHCWATRFRLAAAMSPFIQSVRSYVSREIG